MTYCDYDKYNHISIFFFLLPLLYSYHFNCNKYILINTIWLFTGFTYHFSIRNTKILNTKQLILRYIDISAVNLLIPYIIYHSTYNNIFYYFGIFCVCLLVSIYYIKVINLSHVIIHIIASIGVLNSIESCRLNNCYLCKLDN